MKEIALSFTANLEISKVNKSLQTYNNAAFRMCKIAKEGNISWRAESDGEDGTKVSLFLLFFLHFVYFFVFFLSGYFL